MLKTIAVILVLLWALGWATSSALGGFIHVLVVLALALLLIQTLQAPRARGREASGTMAREAQSPIRLQAAVRPGRDASGGIMGELRNEEALTVWEGEGGSVPAAGAASEPLGFFADPRRVVEGPTHRVDPEPTDRATTGAAVDLSIVARTGGRGTSAPESVELLDGGEEAYPRMLRGIARATRYVHLEVYAFAASGVGARFVDALTRAASRGVAVRVLIDGWGSARGGRGVAAALRAGGCEVRIYNRLLALLVGRFGRNHRKLLLIDDEVAFLGGINIGDENVSHGGRPGWADLAVEIRGPQSAHLGQVIRHELRRPIDSSLRIHLSRLGGGWRLRRLYLLAFARARQRIDVAHGYFLPDRGIVRAIIAAARRGVQVRLLLAGWSDVPFARAATRSLYRRLLAAGVSVHEWSRSMLHAKVATIDGSRLLVGSFNLDPFSLVNLEALVEVADTQIAEQGEAWIRDHFARSRKVTSVDASSRLRRWLLDPFGLLVARVAAVLSHQIASRKRRRGATDPPSSGGILLPTRSSWSATRTDTRRRANVR
ncbi:MAG: lmo0937 family membrane protein [Polyangiaceae bacterium]|nr:lmo0937 family membrane protein [Polyangiaceae bacterium]